MAPFAGLGAVGQRADEPVRRGRSLHDRPLFPHAGGEALDAVGNYHSSRVVPLLLVSIAAMLGTMIMPHLSHDWEAGRHELVAAGLRLFLKLFGFALFAAAVAVLVAAPLLFRWRFAASFPGGEAVLPWTLVYCTWFGLSLVVQNYLLCAEKARLASVALACGLVLSVLLNLVLLPRLGLEGAVLSTTAANALIARADLPVQPPVGLPSRPRRRVGDAVAGGALSGYRGGRAGPPGGSRRGRLDRSLAFGPLKNGRSSRARRVRQTSSSWPHDEISGKREVSLHVRFRRRLRGWWRWMGIDRDVAEFDPAIRPSLEGDFLDLPKREIGERRPGDPLPLDLCRAAGHVFAYGLIDVVVQFRHHFPAVVAMRHQADFIRQVVESAGHHAVPGLDGVDHKCLPRFA